MKHDQSHKLDVACLDCIRVHCENERRLIEFVRQVSVDIVHSEFMADKVRERAIKLLKEIEATND